MTKSLSILGSTGSIGTQSLDVARLRGYTVEALTAYSDVARMEAQIREFHPKTVAMVEEKAAADLKVRVADTNTKVLSGKDGVCACARADGADTVLNSVVGMAGLEPTLAAIDAKKKLALANKETLVAGGQLVMEAAKKNGVSILPVDSEHSAIWQCNFCRFLRDELWFCGHNGPSGSRLRQFIPRPLSFIHIIHTGQHHGFHESLDQRGFAGAHRPDHPDIDIAAGARADLIIDLMIQNFPAFHTCIGISNTMWETPVASAGKSLTRRISSMVVPQSFAISHSCCSS